MPEPVVQGLTLLTHSLEIVGAGALVLGFVVATVRYAREIRSRGARQAFSRYRQAIARGLLIGLEVLVAATIIKTITVEMTPRSLGLLALMIAIRTILSWSTVLEMTGRWPWQKAPATES
jgi:uncharacterized membrane protein